MTCTSANEKNPSLSDVAVSGFDNDMSTGFSLTTVNQPIYELGRRAASMLTDLIHNIDVPKQKTAPLTKKGPDI